tara:strand:- start:4383 stop:6623 length:2241 start_codon:yes stop_codon:yes gene_type:complete
MNGTIIQRLAVDAALSGLSVIPWAYVNGKKMPMMKWKRLQTERMTPQEVADWFDRNPDHNWGVVTGKISNVVVVDLDNQEAMDWARENLPPTNWRVTTGREGSGEHWGYKYPGNDVKNRVACGGMAIDLRGDGGWVAMPPSVHKTNRQYRWANNAQSCPYIEDLPVFDPTWLPARKTLSELNLVERASVGGGAGQIKRAKAWLKKSRPAVENSGGNHHTYTVACQMVKDFGLNEVEAFEAMYEWNQSCVPPWSDKELRVIIRNADEYGTAAKGSKEHRPYTYGIVDSKVLENLEDIAIIQTENSDIGNGQRLAHYFGNAIRYCDETGGWLVWDGKVWAKDKKLAVHSLAKKTSSFIFKEAAELDGDEAAEKSKWGNKSRSSDKINCMMRMARSERNIPVAMDELDCDIWTLNTPNGMIDLRTGDIKPHDPKKLCTKMTAASYEPSTKTPVFDAFMEQIFQGDEDLIKYVTQALGFSLTGSVKEHVFFFCYGTGANGKGTLLNLTMDIMGDYSAALPEGMLEARAHDKHLAELIMLKGLRMAVGAETQEDRRLNEARMKNLTGGDPITADPKGGAYVTFKPTHSMWISGNHKPKIRGTDNGVWRRMKLIPFKMQVPTDQLDKDLGKKLWAERDGILAKLVEGCVSWYRDGFHECKAITAATEAYRKEEDSFGAFILDKCVVNPLAIVPRSSMRKAYLEWCKINGNRELSAIAMGERLRRAGFKDVRKNGQRQWSGVGLTTEKREDYH